MLEGLSESENNLLLSLIDAKIQFLVVGMSAAILQNAPGVTQDIDLWFAQGQIDQLSEACRNVGATYYWRDNPPEIAGPGIDQIDVVWHCHGLNSFEEEYNQAIDIKIAPDKILKVLPLDRIIASKKAVGRPKDKSALPMLRAILKSSRHQQR
jgi:hypothetical protein